MRRLAIQLAFISVFVAGAVGAQQSQQDRDIMNQGNSGSTPSSGSNPGPSGGGTDTGAPPVESELSTTYSSIGLQKIHVKASGVNVKDPVNLDFTVIGFRIPPAPWFAIELNLGFTMIPGQVSSSSSGSSGSGGGLGGLLGGGGSSPGSSSQSDLSLTNAGVFAVLRSTGSLFAMGKVGYRYINSSIEGFPENRSGNAYGVGVGYRWNKKGSYAEFGYTHYSSEISAIGFSVSYSYDRH